MFTAGLVIGLGIVLVVLATRMFFVVHEGESALLTSFGKPIGGGPARVFGPGLHRKTFWQRVHRANLRELLAPLSYDDTRTVLAHDGTPLKVDATVRYHVVPEQLERYLFGVDHAQEHISELFECLARGAIASFGPTERDPTAFSRLRRDRRELLGELDRVCERTLPDDYGIGFNAVDVSSLSPPKELEEALNAVLQAEATARMQLDQAQAACQQKVIAASEGVSVARQKSQAVHDEMTTLAGFLRELKIQGTLKDYVTHRRSEILNQARTVFVRSES